MNEFMVELPKYRSHKVVHAFKIDKIKFDCQLAQEEGRESDGGALLYPAMEEGMGPVKVDHAYVSKHKPFDGGYYVHYKDGYESFSPAKAFEEGYTRI